MQQDLNCTLTLAKLKKNIGYTWKQLRLAVTDASNTNKTGFTEYYCRS